MNHCAEDKVLVLATSPKTKGGISAVIKLHQQCSFWRKFGCRWITTHYRKGIFGHFYDLGCAIAIYLRYLPRCKIVHIHHSESISTLRKSVFFIIAKVFQKKTILHFHAFSPRTTIHGKYSYVYRWLFRRADCVIVLSEYWKNVVVDTCGKSVKIQVLYNPCDTVEPCALPPKKQILYAGTLNQRKGYDVLLKAFSMVHEEHPGWQLAFAGNGDLRQARELAEGLGIASKCIFYGWVMDERKRIVFSESSIFCLPSFAEGFPMAVVDAWAYRLPVITTPVGGLPDVAIDGVNCLLFEPGNVVALSNKLSQLILSSDLREKISCAGNALANNKFSIESVGAKLDSIYENLSCNVYR